MKLPLYCFQGNFKVTSSRGIGRHNGRKNVFSGVAHTLYLPRKTNLLTSTSEILDIAYGWCKSDNDFDPKFITPDKTPIVIFGGG